jgi:tetratricopeptide (TPR) repeat protein
MIFFALILFFSSFDVRAQSGIMSLYNKANSQYRDGDFSSAIVGYEKAIDSGGKTSFLFYNLGNAYFEDENIGKAILWYERARKLAPRDEDIRVNLRFARQVKKDRESEDTGDIQRLLSNLFNFPTMNELSVVYSIGWVCLFFIAGWCVYYRDWKGKLFILSLVFLFISSFSGVWLFSRIYFDAGESPAIVMNEIVTARSGPGINQTEVFVVHEGTKVFVKRKENEWVLIRLHSGLGGWVLESQIESI